MFSLREENINYHECHINFALIFFNAKTQFFEKEKDLFFLM